MTKIILPWNTHSTLNIDPLHYTRNNMNENVFITENGYYIAKMAKLSYHIEIQRCKVWIESIKPILIFQYMHVFQSRKKTSMKASDTENHSSLNNKRILNVHFVCTSSRFPIVYVEYCYVHKVALSVIHKPSTIVEEKAGEEKLVSHWW